MKRIKGLVSGIVTVSASEVTNLTAAQAQIAEARINKSRVVEGALTIENVIASTIADHFFAKSVDRKKEFSQVILGSDWCSFSAKRKLLLHIIESRNLLAGKQKEEFEKRLRKLMFYRNAFTHGTFHAIGNGVSIEFFEARPRTCELTDEFLTEVETCILQLWEDCLKLHFAVSETPAVFNSITSVEE